MNSLLRKLCYKNKSKAAKCLFFIILHAPISGVFNLILGIFMFRNLCIQFVVDDDECSLVTLVSLVKMLTGHREKRNKHQARKRGKGHTVRRKQLRARRPVKFPACTLCVILTF